MKIIIIFLFLFLPLFLYSTEDLLKKPIKRSKKNVDFINSTKVIFQIGSWKERSLLKKEDGTSIKINTLNSVSRWGVQHFLWNDSLYAYYGIVFGQSKNDSDDSGFIYFQRSVLLAGAELGFGTPILTTKTVDLTLSLNGLYRSINHTVPSVGYEFKTNKRMLAMALLEASWKLSDSIYWNQAIGTQGYPLDTFWSIGFGYHLGSSLK